MRLKNLDQAFVLRAMLFYRRELVTTGTERGTGGMPERSDRGFGFNTGID
jgi:hypothetical protein